jgi:hypothetical protein
MQVLLVSWVRPTLIPVKLNGSAHFPKAAEKQKTKNTTITILDLKDIIMMYSKLCTNIVYKFNFCNHVPLPIFATNLIL